MPWTPRERSMARRSRALASAGTARRWERSRLKALINSEEDAQGDNGAIKAPLEARDAEPKGGKQIVEVVASRDRYYSSVNPAGGR